MNTPKNPYRADLRELRFVLWEHLKADATLGADRTRVDALLDEALAFAIGRLGPLYQSSDKDSCRLRPDGTVEVPGGFAELWHAYRERWGGLGGQESLPPVAVQLLLELFMGANPAFMTYGGFCGPGVRLLEEHGTPAQVAAFREPLATSRWTACLCLTEEGAGSDMSEVETRGTPQGDGTWTVEGRKVYISGGMHDLAENIVYFVIGRGATPRAGTLGLSCFIVPRYWPEEDGTLTPNHVECESLIDKMGFKGCVNAALRFGRTGPSRALLLGDVENAGLRQFLTLMNQARISTGVYALGMASSAYLNAVEYARGRIQGKRFHEAFNPASARVPIIEHADVQRMLLEMKSKVEGARLLIARLSFHESLARSGQDAGRSQGLLNLLTPLVKAYVSDQAWRVAELAIQTHGGRGYTDLHPVEQYARDVKVLAIWEGTNFMQSQDLIRDKLAFGRSSRLMGYYLDEYADFMARCGARDELAAERAEVGRGIEALTASLARIAAWVAARRLDLVPQYSTRFLELMGEVTLAWYLLDAAYTAIDARAAAPAAEQPFYDGKVASASFFIWNVLPGAYAKARLIADAEATATAIDPAIFG